MSFQEASYWLLFQLLSFPNPPTWLCCFLLSTFSVFSIISQQPTWLVTTPAQMYFFHYCYSFFIISPSELFSPLLIFFFSHFVSQVTIFMLHLALKFSFQLLCHGWVGQIVRDDRETRSYKCENEIQMREWEGFLVI